MRHGSPSSSLWSYRIAAVAICSLLLAATAGASTYYVRPDGDDSNSGLHDTSMGAWATIQHALDSATAGDVVLVREGTYLERPAVNNQGLPDLPITVRGLGEVILGGLDFPGSNVFSRPVWYYVALENLIFDGDLGLTGSSPYTRSGIRMVAGREITIRDCTFRNYRWASPYYWQRASGIIFGNNAWAESRQILVDGSTFENNDFGGSAPGSSMLVSSVIANSTFRGNEIGYFASNWGTRYVIFTGNLFESNDIGVLLEGVYWYWLKSNNNTFHRSVFANNRIGLLIGDELASAYNGCTYDTRVVNSNFYGNTEAGVLIHTNFSGSNGPSPDYLDSRGQTLVNNIVLGNGTYGLDNAVNQTVYGGYNLGWQNGLGNSRNMPFDASNNSLSADPLLADPAGGDFQLLAGSPCIDAGDPAYDDDPETLGLHVDIGAFEYGRQSPTAILEALIEEAGGVPDSFLNNRNNSLPLSQKLWVAMQMIIRGDEEENPQQASNFYHSASQKLVHDILPKTDGCANGGAPDANDWITHCDTQADFYEPIVSVLEFLAEL